MKMIGKLRLQKKGVFEIRGEKRMLVLYDGKTINSINGKITEFTFSKTDFNISKFSSTTVTQKKYKKLQQTC